MYETSTLTPQNLCDAAVQDKTILDSIITIIRTELEPAISGAAKNAIKVQGFDYEKMASVRDRVTPGSKTYSNADSSYPMSKALPDYLKDYVGELKTLDFDDGGIIEDENGIPLLIKICGLQSDTLQASLPKDLSYTSAETSCRGLWLKLGPNFLTITNSLPPNPAIIGPRYPAPHLQVERLTTHSQSLGSEQGHLDECPQPAAELRQEGQLECIDTLLESAQLAFSIINAIQSEFFLMRMMKPQTHALPPEGAYLDLHRQTDNRYGAADYSNNPLVYCKNWGKIFPAACNEALNVASSSWNPTIDH
ncbi:hypothetical protein DL93DRAFT_2213698 [Clavulina sp. PMI_390]|nr:hypothetical protein DL93DRAFT_2213698 [Clavulina sp. PMI_390]